jgi:hypothetical protein
MKSQGMSALAVVGGLTIAGLAVHFWRRLASGAVVSEQSAENGDQNAEVSETMRAGVSVVVSAPRKNGGDGGAEAFERLSKKDKKAAKKNLRQQVLSTIR